VLADGTEHGIQAKFYTKADKIDWSSIDKSISTALATHPRLTKIYIAIACPLTGATQRKSKAGRLSVSAWDKWEGHKAKWTLAAAALGREVAFEPWSSSDLEELLTRPQMVGLTEYWFGGIELSPKWLRAQADRTIAALDERYHPEDHVNVSVNEVFEGLLRTEEFRDQLVKARNEVLARSALSPLPATYPKAIATKLAEVTAALAAFRSETAALESADWEPWSFSAWEHRCEMLTRVISSAARLARDHSDELRATAAAKQQGSSPPYPSHDPDYAQAELVVDSLSVIRAAVGHLYELLVDRSRHAAEKRFVFLDGRAGSGKSHLIASIVERALEAGIPALFFIGTDFTQHGTIEQQILGRLEIADQRFDALLGALDAKAEAEGTRALVAIDAVNEGAGATLWRPALQAMAQRILAFPRLALCVSCRREYVSHLLMPGARSMAAVVEIRGFETEDELERAAKVYMDRRGIVRPAAPWLNPEFSNPLFLRTTCLALQREGRSQFPRGMRGTNEVLAFFLESTARHLGTDYDGSDVLIAPTQKALLDLASAMAERRSDNVDLANAHAIANGAFAGYAPPPGKTWLETLRYRGLLRIDPNPDLNPADPLRLLPDVVAFSFQRFQDHLIAHALLRDVSSAAGLFDPGAPLAFVLDGQGVHWRWRGVFYAAYVHIADRFGVELVDCLPGGAGQWWDVWEVQDAFVESVRWRSTGAFTDRTRNCLNSVERNIEDIVSLLIELAVVSEHPWNATFIHRNLLARPLAKRDAFWTLAINHAFDASGHPAVRLADWASNAGSSADESVLELAATMLAWFCTSTSGELRDRSTKALTAIFLRTPAIPERVFISFRTCDDLYVVERLAAALYGAALRTYDATQLRTFSRVVWSHVFETGNPPLSMLARDYARGVIELASASKALDAGVDVARCRPPYRSTPPTFNLSANQVDARAARLGAESITRSCYNGLADFGRYTVENRIERFARAPMAGPRPETAQESAARFEKEFAQRPDVLVAIDVLRQAYRQRKITFDLETFSPISPVEDNRRVAKARSALAALLTKTERKRYNQQAEAWTSGQGQSSWIIPGKPGKGEVIDASKAKVWIANRAMSLGWTKRLFPTDRSYGEDRVRGSRTERIGKKYQRIAFGELLARLADNYWLAPDYGEPAKLYDNPLDVEFVRDIDPSILPTDFVGSRRAGIPRVPLLQSVDVPAGQRRAWVREAGLAERALAFATGSDLGSNDWLALYRYASCDIDWKTGNKTCDTPWQQTEFYFASLLLLPEADRNRFLSETQANAEDFHDWLPRNSVDGPFLRELGRRDTWPCDPWRELHSRDAGRRMYRAIRASVGYQWESHLDGSLPDGVQCNLPTPWMMSQLGLRFAPDDLALLVDPDGAPTAFAASEAHSQFAFVHRTSLMRLAASHRLVPIITVIGERMAIAAPSARSLGTRVRYNGILWFEGDEQRTRSWSKED
jgi:hypothetical protein